MKVQIKGTIIQNSDKLWYDWWERESTCPAEVEKAIMEANGETLEVEINSNGGDIGAGSAIYTMLRNYGNLDIQIIGPAYSAASVIAMAGHSTMSPTALMMVHCVSTYAAGNHTDMEKTAEVLKTADEALCSAYMAKAGMSKEEALEMMNNETWLTAEQAKEKGLIDEIKFSDLEQDQKDVLMVAAYSGYALTKEQINKARAAIEAQKQADLSAENAVKLDTLKAQYNYLKLKGEMRNEL